MDTTPASQSTTVTTRYIRKTIQEVCREYMYHCQFYLWVNEYLAMDNGGDLRMNTIRALTAPWLNAFPDGLG